MITIDQLRAGITNSPDNLEDFIDPLNEGIDYAQLNTHLRLASFLGQALIESDNFTKMRENMMYHHHPENAIPRLYEVFKNNKVPVFSSPEEAEEYEGKPEAIANKVYANILGNGNEDSGDGWKFRGGGLFGVTGKGQFNLCGVALDVDLVNNPELIETPRYAVMSGMWYWKTNGLNRYADNKSFELLTRAVNRAKLKLIERIAATQRYLSILEQA